jgi:hypothetical protein
MLRDLQQALFLPLNGVGFKQISGLSLALISSTSTPFVPLNTGSQDINHCSLDEYPTCYNVASLHPV